MASLPPARPSRPNPLALDIVELLEVKGNRLTVRGMDALDGSILLDIKPYSAGIDSSPRPGSPGRRMENAVEMEFRHG